MPHSSFSSTVGYTGFQVCGEDVRRNLDFNLNFANFNKAGKENKSYMRTIVFLMFLLNSYSMIL